MCSHLYDGVLRFDSRVDQFQEFLEYFITLNSYSENVQPKSCRHMKNNCANEKLNQILKNDIPYELLFVDMTIHGQFFKETTLNPTLNANINVPISISQ